MASEGSIVSESPRAWGDLATGIEVKVGPGVHYCLRTLAIVSRAWGRLDLARVLEDLSLSPSPCSLP